MHCYSYVVPRGVVGEAPAGAETSSVTWSLHPGWNLVDVPFDDAQFTERPPTDLWLWPAEVGGDLFSGGSAHPLSEMSATGELGEVFRGVYWVYTEDRQRVLLEGVPVRSSTAAAYGWLYFGVGEHTSASNMELTLRWDPSERQYQALALNEMLHPGVGYVGYARHVQERFDAPAVRGGALGPLPIVDGPSRIGGTPETLGHPPWADAFGPPGFGAQRSFLEAASSRTEPSVSARPDASAFEDAHGVSGPTGALFLPRAALSRLEGRSLAYVAYLSRGVSRFDGVHSAGGQPGSVGQVDSGADPIGVGLGGDEVWIYRSDKAGKPESFVAAASFSSHEAPVIELSIAAEGSRVAVAWMTEGRRTANPNTSVDPRVWISESLDGGQVFGPPRIIRENGIWKRGLSIAYDVDLNLHLVWGEGNKVFYLKNLSGAPSNVFDVKTRSRATDAITRLVQYLPDKNGRCDCLACWCEESYLPGTGTGSGGKRGDSDSYVYRTEEHYVYEPSLDVSGDAVTVAARRRRMWDSQPVPHDAWWAMTRAPVYSDTVLAGEYPTRALVGWNKVWKSAYEAGDEARYAGLGIAYQYRYQGTWHEPDEIVVAQRPLVRGAWAEAVGLDGGAQGAGAAGWREGSWEADRLQSWRLTKVASVGLDGGDDKPSHPRVVGAPFGYVAVYEDGPSENPNAVGFNPIRLQSSVDGGRSWSAPRTVGTGYMPTVGLVQSGGLALLAYAPRLQEGGVVSGLYSQDGGDTFGEVALLNQDLAKPIHWKSHGSDAGTMAGGASLVTHEDLFFAAWIERSQAGQGEDRLVTTRASPVTDAVQFSVALPPSLSEGQRAKMVVTAENIYHMRVHSEEMLRVPGHVTSRGGSVSLDRGQAAIWVDPAALLVGGRSDLAPGELSVVPAAVRVDPAASLVQARADLAGVGSLVAPSTLGVDEDARPFVQVSLARVQGGEGLDPGVPMFAASVHGNALKARWLRDRLWRDGGVSGDGRPLGYQVEYLAVEDGADGPAPVGPSGSDRRGLVSDAEYLAAYERVWAYTQGIALAQYAQEGTRQSDARAQALAGYLCAQAERVDHGKRGRRALIRGWPFSWNTSGDRWKDTRLVTGATAWVIHGLGIFLVSDAFKALTSDEQGASLRCYREALEGLEEHRRSGRTEEGRRVSLMTAGWTARGLAYAHRPWKLKRKRGSRLGEQGESWDYYDVLDALGYENEDDFENPLIRRRWVDSRGGEVERPPLVLSKADFWYIKEIIRADNVVTEHNLDVLSVLNHALNHSEALGIGDRDRLEDWRNELRAGIFDVLWDANDIHWRNDLENAREASGVYAEKRQEIEAALLEGDWGRVATGGEIHSAEEDPVSPGGIRIDQGLLGRIDFVPNRRHTAIDNCSWLSLSVDYPSLTDEEDVDALARCLAFTSLAFGKQIAFRGQSYYGAHYFFDGFEDRYIAATARQESSFHLEATTGLIMGLWKFVEHHPEHPKSSFFRREADALWEGVQRFVFDHGFPYSSQRILDLSTQLTSSTAIIWFIDTYAYRQGGAFLAAHGALGSGVPWAPWEGVGLAEGEGSCGMGETVSVSEAISEDSSELVATRACGEDRLMLRPKSLSVIENKVNGQVATKMGEAALKLRTVLTAAPGEVNLMAEVAGVALGLGISLGLGQSQVMEWLVDWYGWRALRLYSDPPEGPWLSLGYARLSELNGQKQEDILGVADLLRPAEQGHLEPHGKLSSGKIYAVVTPPTVVSLVPQLPVMLPDPAAPYVEIYEYLGLVERAQPVAFGPDVDGLEFAPAVGGDEVVSAYRAWAKAGWFLLAELQKQLWFQNLSGSEQWAYLWTLLDPQSQSWWPLWSSSRVVPPTWVHVGEPSNPLFVGVVLNEMEGARIMRSQVAPSAWLDGTWYATFPGKHGEEYWSVNSEDLSRLPDHLRALHWVNGRSPRSSTGDKSGLPPKDGTLPTMPSLPPGTKLEGSGHGVYYGLPRETYVSSVKRTGENLYFVSSIPPTEMFLHGLGLEDLGDDVLAFLSGGPGGFHLLARDPPSVSNPDPLLKEALSRGDGLVWLYTVETPSGSMDVNELFTSLGHAVPSSLDRRVVVPQSIAGFAIRRGLEIRVDGEKTVQGEVTVNEGFWPQVRVPAEPLKKNWREQVALTESDLVEDQAFFDEFVGGYLDDEEHEPTALDESHRRRVNAADVLVVWTGPEAGPAPWDNEGPFSVGFDLPADISLHLEGFQFMEYGLEVNDIPASDLRLGRHYVYYVANDGRALRTDADDGVSFGVHFFREPIAPERILGAQEIYPDPLTGQHRLGTYYARRPVDGSGAFEVAKIFSDSVVDMVHPAPSDEAVVNVDALFRDAPEHLDAVNNVIAKFKKLPALDAMEAEVFQIAPPAVRRLGDVWLLVATLHFGKRVQFAQFLAFRSDETSPFDRFAMAGAWDPEHAVGVTSRAIDGLRTKEQFYVDLDETDLFQKNMADRLRELVNPTSRGKYIGRFGPQPQVLTEEHSRKFFFGATGMLSLYGPARVWDLEGNGRAAIESAILNNYFTYHLAANAQKEKNLWIPQRTYIMANLGDLAVESPGAFFNPPTGRIFKRAFPYELVGMEPKLKANAINVTLSYEIQHAFTLAFFDRISADDRTRIARAVADSSTLSWVTDHVKQYYDEKWVRSTIRYTEGVSSTMALWHMLFGPHPDALELPKPNMFDRPSSWFKMVGLLGGQGTDVLLSPEVAFALGRSGHLPRKAIHVLEKHGLESDTREWTSAQQNAVWREIDAKKDQWLADRRAKEHD